MRRACCALASPLRGHHVSSPRFAPPSLQLSNPASHSVILPTNYFLLPGRVQKTSSVASGDTGCRAAGIPPSQGGCLPPRTWAGSAASTRTEHGAGTLQAVMDQTSPPTEVKTDEEMRQARRRGIKTPASSHETEAMASFGSCRAQPQPHPSPTVLDRKDTRVSRGHPGWSPQPPWVAHPFSGGLAGMLSDHRRESLPLGG